MFPAGDVPFTGPGKELGAAIADDDQLVTLAGQNPFVVGATCTDPGVEEVVAQLT